MKQILKRCPFCGGEADVFRIPENTPEEMATHPDWRWNHPGKWIVGCYGNSSECLGDMNHMAMIFETEWEAIEMWNRRVTTVIIIVSMILIALWDMWRR